VSPSFSSVAPNFTESPGTGLGPTLSQDYLCINSIDEDDAGDFLISARHTSTIYKISDASDTTLWQLSGSNATSCFTPANGLNSSFQHEVHLRHQSATTAILTISDNAANSFHNQSALYSFSLLVVINHRTSTATLLQRYLPPEVFTSQQPRQRADSASATVENEQCLCLLESECVYQ
jgi:hypothetical protein